DEEKYASTASHGGGVSAMKSSKLKPTFNRTGKRYEGERKRRARGTLSSEVCEKLPLEYLLYLLRRAAGSREKTEMFICSLSAKTVTYKGQLTCSQLFEYYKDLNDPGLTTHLAMVHSRF
ncbi:glutamate synthase, putative, partial [Perkinsus marinus ATCC 50983]